MKASVDESCTACGLCAETCPEVFELPDDADTARVIVDVVPPEAEESCREAADNCPVEAIILKD
jgi:ferredoxin